MSKICVVGCGFVGLTVAASLGARGHKVVGVDRNLERMASLRRGDVPFHEPGLSESIKKSDAEFVSELPSDADLYVVCVGTPPTAMGVLDCEAVENAVADIVAVRPGAVVAIKSTLMPGTCRKIFDSSAERYAKDARLVPPLLCLWPEMFREGSAMRDFDLQATVIGTAHGGDDRQMFEFWHSLWLDRVGVCPTRIVSFESAEMFKLALNGYLAMRVAYINEVSVACSRSGADIREVQSLMSLDNRVGGTLFAGPGYGGSCWPKDVPALCHVGQFVQTAGSVVANIEWSNRIRMRRLRGVIAVDCARYGADGMCRVAVIGCAFKENTSDLRCSPAVGLIEWMTTGDSKFDVSVWDPWAMAEIRERFPSRVRFGTDVDDACRGADVLVLMNDVFGGRNGTLAAIEHAALVMAENPILVDTRNLLTQSEAESAGFAKYVRM